MAKGEAGNEMGETRRMKRRGWYDDWFAFHREPQLHEGRTPTVRPDRYDPPESPMSLYERRAMHEARIQQMIKAEEKRRKRPWWRND